MKLSLQWYLTNYFESLHTYYCILDASISRFDWWLVNQQRQIIDCVFVDFSIHPDIWHLWGKISPLTRKPQHLFSFPFRIHHLISESHQKSLRVLPYLSWMPSKICNCDKLLSTTTVTQFWLQAVTWPNKPTFYSSLYIGLFVFIHTYRGGPLQ